jgi:hypothetical protein
MTAQAAMMINSGESMSSIRANIMTHSTLSQGQT